MHAAEVHTISLVVFFSHLPHNCANVRMCHTEVISLINADSVLKFRPSFLDVVGLRVQLETSEILFCLIFILNHVTVFLLKALRSLMQSIKIFEYTWENLLCLMIY